MSRIIKSLLAFVLICFFGLGYGYMASDIVFTGLSLTQTINSTGGLAPGEFGVYQNSAPEFTAVVINNPGGDDLFTGGVGGGLQTGFITCEDTSVSPGLVLYSSTFINAFLVQEGTQQVITNIVLPQGATANAGALIQLACTFDYNSEFNLTPTSIKTATINLRVLESPAGRFDVTLGLAKESIKEKLDVAIPERGAGGVLQFILNIINDIVIPIMILVGIFLALIGFYKMFFSESPDALAEGFNYLTWGAIGVIVMMLAPFVANNVFDVLLDRGEVTSFNAVETVGQLYDIIIYPIIKIAIYLLLGILFLILISRVFLFMTATQEEVISRTRNILISLVIGMLVILGSNEMIEFVYGSEADIRNTNATQVSDVGGPLFNDPNIPLFYEIVRWAMAIAVFAILAIIIWQAFRLLFRPDSDETITDIKNNILYVFIGVLVIGAGYLITNFFLVA